MEGSTFTPLTPCALAVGGVLDAISDVEDMAEAFETLGLMMGSLHHSVEIKHYALGVLMDAMSAELRRRVTVAGEQAAEISGRRARASP